MSSLTSIVSAFGVLHAGMGSTDDPDRHVLALQHALTDAGYRVGEDGVYGPRTQMVVAQFQKQQGIASDGIVGERTAALLDVPHTILVEKAIPLTTPHPVTNAVTPHDDTASLTAFYGNPEDEHFAANIVPVPAPWPLTYAGAPWKHSIQLHKRCAPLFAAAFDRIWSAAGKDPHSPMLFHVSRFGGSGNNRSVRGSSRKSCHAFYAAIDFDPEHLPMVTSGRRFLPAEMPAEVVDAFESSGLYWGGRFVGRQDAMHIQGAHE